LLKHKYIFVFIIPHAHTNTHDYNKTNRERRKRSVVRDRDMRTRDPEFIIPSTEGSVFPDSVVGRAVGDDVGFTSSVDIEGASTMLGSGEVKKLKCIQ
jgi:hypothetical protein